MKIQRLGSIILLFSVVILFSCNSKNRSKNSSSSEKVDEYLEKADYAENNKKSLWLSQGKSWEIANDTTRKLISTFVTVETTRKIS